MRIEHLGHLVCPKCKEALICESFSKDPIKEGELICSKCSKKYPIVNFIPRFVSDGNYANNFGLEWNIHAKTQYDDVLGNDLSSQRFFEETRWPKCMDSTVILEAGSGSGRFTEHALSTGATVVSFDYSSAVEANYQSNGHHPNLCLVQANIYEMPFKEGYFDKLFCLGVIQHTPDVKQSFMELPKMLKSGGSLVVDVYKREPWYIRWLQTKNWVYPLTRRMNIKLLYAMVKNYINVMWPLTRWLNGSKFGKRIIWSLLIADYTDTYELDDKALKELAILDTYDILSPRYTTPQTLQTFRSWFDEAKLSSVDIHYGYNGIEGRAIRA